MSTVTGFAVANTILMLAFQEHIEISNLKLQKLVYFVYRDYLQATKDPLFSERFETWKHGPVLPSIYQEFSSFGSKPITRFATDASGNAYIIDMKQDSAFKAVVLNVWKQYRETKAWDLRDLTHSPGSAWDKAFHKKSRFLSDDDIQNEHLPA